MDTVKKVIYFSVGIILTVGFIAMGVSMYNKSKDTILGAEAQYDSIISRFSDLEFAMYDGNGSSASGSEVTRLITGLEDENITIYVKNGAYLNSSQNGEGVAYSCKDGNHCGYGSEGSTSVSYEKAKELMAQRNSGMFYINPTASFAASVHRDDNGQVDSLFFVQK